MLALLGTTLALERGRDGNAVLQGCRASVSMVVATGATGGGAVGSHASSVPLPPPPAPSV